jgi:thiol-disulfide isomerase/thioredoxin
MSVFVYHFSSPTCAPCKQIKHAVEDLKEEFSELNWVSVNTHDDLHDYAGKFRVSVVPTILVVKQNSDGTHVVLDKHSGVYIAEYYRILRKGVASSRV